MIRQDRIFWEFGRTNFEELKSILKLDDVTIAFILMPSTAVAVTRI